MGEKKVTPQIKIPRSHYKQLLECLDALREFDTQHDKEWSLPPCVHCRTAERLLEESKHYIDTKTIIEDIEKKLGEKNV